MLAVSVPEPLVFVVVDLATPKKLPVVTTPTPLVSTAVVVSAAAATAVVVVDVPELLDVDDVVVTAAAAATALTVVDELELVVEVTELVVEVTELVVDELELVVVAASAMVMTVGVCMVTTLPPGCVVKNVAMLVVTMSLLFRPTPVQDMLAMSVNKSNQDFIIVLLSFSALG